MHTHTHTRIHTQTSSAISILYSDLIVVRIPLILLMQVWEWCWISFQTTAATSTNGSSSPRSVRTPTPITTCGLTQRVLTRLVFPSLLTTGWDELEQEENKCWEVAWSLCDIVTVYLCYMSVVRIYIFILWCFLFLLVKFSYSLFVY